MAKKRGFLLVFAAFILFILLRPRGRPDSASHRDLAWQTITVKEGGFRVSMPGAARLRETTEKTGDGVPITFKVLELIRQDLPAVFSAYGCDFPAEPIDAGPVLDVMCRAMRAERKGVIRVLKAISLHGRAGKEVHIEFNDRGLEKIQISRLFFRGRRHHHFIVTTAKSQAGASYVGKFLDSVVLEEPW
jgi:hypothetical protein